MFLDECYIGVVSTEGQGNLVDHVCWWKHGFEYWKLCAFEDIHNIVEAYCVRSSAYNKHSFWLPVVTFHDRLVIMGNIDIFNIFIGSFNINLLYNIDTFVTRS